MRQGKTTARVVMLVLFAGVLVYLGVYVWRGLHNPFTTVAAYGYSVNDAAPATGILVRREFVLPAQGAIIDVLPAEGEKVGAGQTVAMVYRDTAALDRRLERNALRFELDQLNYALRRRDSVGDLAQLDNDIVQGMAALRGRTAAADLTGLEEYTLGLRSLVLKRMIPYDSAAESVAAIEAMIADTTAQLRALDSAAALDSTPVVTDRAGIYSAMVDGYETIATPDGLSQLTAGGLDALLTLQPDPPPDALGKLITDSRWHFAALVDEAAAARLEVGGQMRVAFSRDFVGEVSMRVDHISAPEDGMCAVVFSSTRFLSETTLLRRQTVELLFRQYDGIRLPKEAVRVQEGVQGVYVVVGAQAEFKPVTIVREGETFFLVTAANTGKRILRPGDEVVVTAEELHEGKVIR